MARPQKCRRICAEPAFDNFAPANSSSDETSVLTVDEYEAIRLIDFEKKTQVQCAELMDISRPAITEMYERARFKIADCIVNGKTLIITGGNYRLCDGSIRHCCGKKCRRQHNVSKQINIKGKGESIMRIAVTYDNENVFQHFGHTEKFKFYDIENNAVAGTQIVDTMGSGHGALAGFLVQNKVDTLICGGIGGGAQNALTEAGIRLYGGVTGNADNAVKALLDGTLAYNPDIKCAHHGHGEHQHHCGENRHGCHGNHE